LRIIQAAIICEFHIDAGCAVTRYTVRVVFLPVGGCGGGVRGVATVMCDGEAKRYWERIFKR
jgi:hypothetical protein